MRTVHVKGVGSPSSAVQYSLFRFDHLGQIADKPREDGKVERVGDVEGWSHPVSRQVIQAGSVDSPTDPKMYRALATCHFEPSFRPANPRVVPHRIRVKTIATSARSL